MSLWIFNRAIEDDRRIVGQVFNVAGGCVDEDDFAVAGHAVRLVDVTENIVLGLDPPLNC